MSDVVEQTQTPEQAQAEPTTPPAAATSGDTGKTFTQAELERVIADRLERQAAQFKAQREKVEKDAAAAALKEQGEFKTLYEQAQAELAKAQGEIAAQARAALLRRVAKAAGLDPDDEDLVSRLRGDDEESLTADAKKLAARLAPVATPPNLNGGRPPVMQADTKAREDEIRRRYRI